MAKVNQRQIERVAELMKGLPDGGGLNFYSFGSGDNVFVAKEMYPPLNHPEAPDFFFFVCLHQFGFWYGNAVGYHRPLVGQMDGKPRKGSDLLWRAAMKEFNRDPTTFWPAWLAQIPPEQLFNQVLVDDNGPIPFPDLEERLLLTQKYGIWMKENNLTPTSLLERLKEHRLSLRFFRDLMKDAPGFRWDPFQKKILLLAMALANRPERFLQPAPGEAWPPIVDYHLMRVSLRLGLVDLGGLEAERNSCRTWVSAEEEHQIRQAVHTAVTRLIAESGKPMSFVDEKMWMARKYCPEMKVPDCSECLFRPACAKRIELFQPVLRTTNY